MKKDRSIFQVFITIVMVLVLILGAGAAPASAVAVDSQSVIVQSASADQAAAVVAEYGGTVTSQLAIINGVGARVPKAAVARLKNDARVARVSTNAETRLTEHSFDVKGSHTPASDYPEVTGANLAWEQGVTGNGVTVAVLDTGIAQHPALKKGLDGKSSKVIGWVDFVDGKNKPRDPNGHGTHIAGIIANAGLGTDGSYNGMAPGADLVGVRVLDETGQGNYETVIQGIQWVIDHKAEYNIKVINLSLHAMVQSPYWADPLNQAVMKAWASGVTVIVAAGNEGPGAMSISVPGNNPYVVTVGAFTDNYTPNDWSDDYVAEFSAAGPTLDGFVKPDLLAPGAHMVSTMMPGSYIARNHEANWVDSQYFSMAGTSQSAAVVSGIAAMMLSKYPDLTPDQVKHRLMITSLAWIKLDQSDVLYSVWQQGAGRANAFDAATAPDITGSANTSMDIQADIAGATHYEGYSYFDDATGTFRLRGFETLPGGFGTWSGGFGTWSGGFGTWSGGFGTWSGGFGTWSGGFGTWSGGFGTWSGGFGTWSGGYGTWSGGYGTWSGGYGTWSGRYGTWSGGYGTWSGGYGTWSGAYFEPAFVERFMSGESPDAATSSASLHWVEEK